MPERNCEGPRIEISGDPGFENGEFRVHIIATAFCSGLAGRISISNTDSSYYKARDKAKSTLCEGCPFAVTEDSKS